MGCASFDAVKFGNCVRKAKANEPACHIGGRLGPEGLIGSTAGGCVLGIKRVNYPLALAHSKVQMGKFAASRQADLTEWIPYFNRLTFADRDRAELHMTILAHPTIAMINHQSVATLAACNHRFGR